MSLLTTVQDVCAFVGVNRPTSVIAGIAADRTMQEMLAQANEAARAVAYDEREWTLLKKPATLTGDGVAEAFNLPTDYRRMLLTAEVWRSTSNLQPMVFYPDTDEWLRRRAYGYTNAWGEWTIYGGQMHIWPIMSGPVSPNPAITARFAYLDKNCIRVHGSPTIFGDEFLNDDDTFRLDERLLKLCMIWRWKQSKGSPYAEDMSNYEIALSRVAGADKPAPIIAHRLPVSSAVRVAVPWPPNWGPQ